VSKCATCKYRIWAASQWCCNYGEIMSHARMLICPPGDQCTVYKYGKHGVRKITLQGIAANRRRATRK